jgi:hypothetical protein
LYAFLISYAYYMPVPSYPLDLITLVTFSEVYKLWSSSLCSVLQPPATSSAPYFQTSSICSSFTPTQNNK